MIAVISDRAFKVFRGAIKPSFLQFFFYLLKFFFINVEIALVHRKVNLEFPLGFEQTWLSLERAQTSQFQQK